MSLPSSSASLEKSGSENMPTPPGRRGLGRGRLWFTLALLALLVALASFAGQWLSTRQHSMQPGRPLSYPQTHLHTIALSTRPGVVYLGTHYGIFTSTDGGHTWPQSQGGLNTSMITAIAASPSNPDLVAVLAVPTSGLSSHMGIYVSTNAGRSWSFTAPAGLAATAYPYTIQSGLGARGHFYAFFSFAGWFETQDLGQHWRAITSGPLAHIQAPSLLTDPGDPAHLLMGGDLGLFETRDDGQNWQQVKNVSGNVLSLVATVPTANAPRTILATTDQGLYRWQETPGDQEHISQITSLPASSSPTRVVMSNDGSALYALFGSDLWFSADQGTNWTQRWHFTRGDLVALNLNPTNPRELLAGFYSPALVLISDNAGSSWQTLTH